MKPQTSKPKNAPQIIYNKTVSYQKKVIRLGDYDICLTYDFSEWLCTYDYEAVARYKSIKDIILSYLLRDETLTEVACTEYPDRISCILYYSSGEKHVIEFSNVL